MAGPVDPQKRADALAMVFTYLGLRPGDIIRFDCSFVGEIDHFVVRIDYTATRKGGYQILEGFLDGGVRVVSPVLGRGRVTPRFNLTPSLPVRTPEEVEEERQRLELEWETKRLDDRIV